ncbi:MAG TPA: DUF2298 domain-containing protein [Anaerolineae bacterium]|nr:DUF2298 domain-containing protein [Anaerolineae bacterium]
MSSPQSQRPSNPPPSLLDYMLLAVGLVIAGIYTRLLLRQRSHSNGSGLPQLSVGSSASTVTPVQPPPAPIEVSQVTVLEPVRAPKPQPVIEEPREPLRPVHIAAFVAILLVGFYFRFTGLNWDASQHLHPDERFLTDVLTRVEIPDSLGEYFDSQTSSLNPRNHGHTFFVYGDLPITIGRLVAEGLTGLCQPDPTAPLDAQTGRPAPTLFDSLLRGLGFDTFCYRADGSFRALIGYDEVALVGRALSALFDLGTLIWLFLIAREVYSVRAGLAAMALGALAVLHIQQAHFFTADTFATHFVAAAFYFSVRAWKTGAWFDFAAAGVGSGLAMACRINVAPLLGIVALAAFVRAIHGWNGWGNAGRIELAFSQTILAAAAALIAFRIFMPNAFSGLIMPDERWLSNMGEISKIVSGEATAPPDVQWTDRRALVFPWVNVVFWGMGLPLGLAAWIGWAVIGWRLLGRPFLSIKNRTIGEWLRAVASSKHVLIWVWVTAYFAWQGTQWVKSIRYLLPLYPFLAIFAGWLLVSVWDWARAASRAAILVGGDSGRRQSASGGLASGGSALGGSASGDASYNKRWVRAIAYALPAVVLAGTLLWAVAFTEIYRQTTTRVAASEWIYENVPTAATLHYTDSTGPRQVQLPLPNLTTFAGPGSPQIIGFSVPTNGSLAGITIRELHDPGADLSEESLTFVVAQDPSGSPEIASATATEPFTGEPGRPVDVAFPRASLQAGITYYLVGYTDADSAPLDFSASLVVDTAGNVLPIEVRPSEGLPPGVLAFSVPQDSTLISATANIRPEAVTGSADVLRVRIALDADGNQTIAQGQIEVPGGAPAGSYDLPFDNAPLTADQPYFFIGEATNGSLIAAGSQLVNEHWDDGIPIRVGGRDGFSVYRGGVDATNYDDDTLDKLGRMLNWLDQADYLFLTSNRLYGSIPRQPLRYPLATEYYRLLFTGQLGFDLVAEFTSYPRLGPFEFIDQETTQALGLQPDPTRLPKPGVIDVPYPPAEEAFSVYDHPRVLIYQKRADFSLQDVIAKLSRLDLETGYHGFRPRDETASPTGQMLTEPAWETQQANGAWSELFQRDGLLNANPGLGVVAWYVLVAALGLAAFPILFVAAPGLADRGYGLARTLGVLLLSFLVWFPASFRILPFTREALLLMALVLAAAGGLIARSRRLEIRDWWRRNARLILTEEIVFGAAFLLFLLLRFGNPDLWHPWKGGEKPMDFAYFNAIIKSQYFPPYDPWFSGGFMTYYYYGWVMLAGLTKLLGTVPAIAYNIAVPTVYALAALGAFSVAHGLASRFGLRISDLRFREHHQLPVTNPQLPIAVGVIAAVFVMLIGNLGEVKLLYDEFGRIGQTSIDTRLPVIDNTAKFVDGLLKVATGQQQLEFPSDWWYWNPTRIIPAPEGEAGPITEFPFFTFLYADLHAHMMALPLTILVLGLAVSWLTHVPLRNLPGLAGRGGLARAWWPGVLSLILGGIAIGALRAANTADYPTYVGVGIVALAFGTWAAESLREKGTWLRFILRVGLLIGAATLLFMPFGQSDRLGGTTLEGWQGSKTELWAYLFVHGIFLFPIVTYLFLETRRWGWRWMSALWNRLGSWRWLIGVPAGIVALALLYFALTGVTVVFVAAPLIAIAGVLMLRPRLPVVTRFWYLMVFLALALSLAVELVVFRGDISRMNMVFKFYYQIWTLLGIAGAVALGWLWSRSSIVLPRFNRGWRTAMVVLAAAGLLYPPFAARAKLSERFTEGAPPGLDGMAYMRDAVYSEVNDAGEEHLLQLRWDQEALMWMQDHIPGTPVVAEGRSRHEYLWGSRVSIYTGLPTLFGWANHQRQQRGVVVPGSVIDQRLQDTALLYGEPNLVTTQKIIQRYGIKYIYVGELEKMYYPAEGLAKFDQMVQEGALRIAHENPAVKIYEVVEMKDG